VIRLATICLFLATLTAQAWTQQDLLMRNAYGVRGQRTTWTPANTTTEWWLDATDSSSLTVTNNLIAVWADKSGNGYVATNDTHGLRPSLATNGTQCVWFGNGFGLRSVIPSLNAIGPYSIVIVCLPKLTSSTRGVLSTRDDSNGSGWAIRTAIATNTCSTFNTGKGSVTLATALSLTNNAYILTRAGSTNSPYITLSVNGGASSGSTTVGGYTVTPSSTVAIGGSTITSLDYYGYLYEVVAVLTTNTNEVNKIEGYLSYKYSIPLAVNHPYFSAPPNP
jgi:hypothetical protein